MTSLVTIDPDTGESATPLWPEFTTFVLGDNRGTTFLAYAGSSTAVPGLREFDLVSGTYRDVILTTDDTPDLRYYPTARPETLGGIHAIVYPPRNEDYAAPPGTLPPYIAHVHGGPTTHVQPTLSRLFAYFTSRGIGVIDINYGGSTGYGRHYRKALTQQWGIVDVRDVITAITALADRGDADPGRLGIQGCSAGGWTVLSALTTTDVFACGASYFGIAELTKFVQETHDFESRYIDGLIGPLPDAAELYANRAPLNNIDNLRCPVLLLQGLDDPIVPPSQAERFRDALSEKGIPHAYMAFEGESHGFNKPGTIIAATEAELSFYGQIMGFTPPGIPTLNLN